jgi:hypothetical protein
MMASRGGYALVFVMTTRSVGWVGKGGVVNPIWSRDAAKHCSTKHPTEQCPHHSSRLHYVAKLQLVLFS